MYMQEPHGHLEWVKKKEENLLSWKAKRTANITGEGDGGGAASQATQDKPSIKLSLAKSYTQALTTKMSLLDMEAEYIMEEMMKNEGVGEIKEWSESFGK